MFRHNGSPGGNMGIRHDLIGDTGRLIWLIGGSTGTRDDWKPLTTAIGPELTLVRADPPTDLAPHAISWIQRLAVLHQRYSRRAPMLVGEGTGGWLACQFAARFACHGLVTISAAAPASPHAAEGLGPMLPAMSQVKSSHLAIRAEPATSWQAHLLRQAAPATRVVVYPHAQPHLAHVSRLAGDIHIMAR